LPRHIIVNNNYLLNLQSQMMQKTNQHLDQHYHMRKSTQKVHLTVKC